MIFAPFWKYSPKVGIILCCLYLCISLISQCFLLKFKALYYS